MPPTLIMPAQKGLATPHARTSLMRRAEQVEKHDIRSWALVSVQKDGRVDVDFDLKDLSPNEIAAVGQGVYALYERLVTMQQEALHRQKSMSREDERNLNGRMNESQQDIDKRNL